MGRYAVLIVSAIIFSMLMYSSALKNALLMSNTRTVQSHSINQAQNIAQSAAMVAITDLREDVASIFNPQKDSSVEYPSKNTFQSWEDLHGDYNLVPSNQGDTLLAMQSTGKFGSSFYQVKWACCIPIRNGIR